MYHGNAGFNIFSFAPSGEILTANMVKDINTVGNMYSIGLIISIGQFNIMLAGDVENRTFRIIPESDLCDQIDFIKMPHHGSSTGKYLVNKLKEMNVLAPSVATTTVYRLHNLPDSDVIEVYKKWDPQIKVYSSGQCSENLDKERIGIIQTVFDVLLEQPDPIEVSLYGNAVEL